MGDAFARLFRVECLQLLGGFDFRYSVRVSRNRADADLVELVVAEAMGLEIVIDFTADGVRLEAGRSPP